MDVTLSGSVLYSSISPGDFTIDGNAATIFTIVNDHELTFAFPTTANGTHNVVDQRAR